MPSSIPYSHPSLVLGNIVNPDILRQLQLIGSLQARIDAAQNKMNAFIAMKRSLEMTVSELLNMNVDVSAITDRIAAIDKEIAAAATDYITVRLTNETAIRAAQEEIDNGQPEPSLQSPVDFTRSPILKLPLSADSLHLDAQYFSYEENQETNPLGVVAEIEDYLKAAAGSLGTKAASDDSNKAVTQINLQRRNHQLSGTLIITATCTHRQANLFSPCILDTDRAVEIWNASFPQDNIDTGNPATAAGSNAATTQLNATAGAAQPNATAPSQSVAATTQAPGNQLSLLSGATYGSCFIGMVHVLKNDATGNSDALTTLAAGLQDRFRIGNWFQEASGGFGVDPATAEDIKSLLSTQTITTHVNLVTMGALPSIRSNQLQMGVRSFTDIDPAKINAGLAALANATKAEKTTVDQAANAAKTGARAMAMQGSTIRNVMLGLGRIDQGANKIIDINTLMNAFEDYIQEIKNGEAGIPVSFFVTNISKNQLLTLLREKYYPDTRSQVSGDPAKGSVAHSAG
jgi:hypothetical protein